MARNVIILSSFERSVKKLSSQQKVRLTESLEAFNHFLKTMHTPFGFGFKKINHDKYEFRVDLKLRVVVKKEDNNFYLILIGSHDDIRKYLRNFR